MQLSIHITNSCLGENNATKITDSQSLFSIYPLLIENFLDLYEGKNNLFIKKVIEEKT